MTFREVIRAFEDGTAARECRRASGTAQDGSLPPESAPRRHRVWTARDSAAQSRRARAVGLHDDGTPDRRHRDLARLHIRLQLLLDHRDARAELSPLPDRPRDRGHPRRVARGARCLFIVDDNITLDVARFEELCTAIIRAGLQRHRLHRAGDDRVDRVARRAAGAVDARGRIPLCVPGHRERARGGPRVSKANAKNSRRLAGPANQHRAWLRSTCFTATACSSSAA